MVFGACLAVAAAAGVLWACLELQKVEGMAGFGVRHGLAWWPCVVASSGPAEGDAEAVAVATCA